MLILYDLNHVKIAPLPHAKSPKLERELFGEEVLSFSYPQNDSRYQQIQEECYIRTGNNEYIVKEVNEGTDWTEFVCKINVEGLKGNAIDHFETIEQTATAATNLALAGTGWTIGSCNVAKLRTVRKQNSNSYEILQEIRTVYRCDLSFDAINKKVYIYQEMGTDKGAYFIDKLNLKSLDVQRNSYDFCTRLIPIGKDGLTIESVNGGRKYVENYQYSNKLITAYWEDNRYTVVQSLLEDAVARLNELSKPRRSYKADVIDMTRASGKYSILDYNLGDTITLVDSTKRVRDKQRIVKTIEYLEEPEKNQVEIANQVLSLEYLQVDLLESADTVDSITTTDGQVLGSKIDGIEYAKIKNVSIATADIQDASITSAKIGSAQITTAHIADAAITNAKIANLAVDTAKIKDASITNAKIANAAIGSAQIIDAAITNAKIANLAVDNAKIALAAIDTSKIQTSAITTALIADGAITSAKIMTAAIGTAQIADASIVDAKISNISASKLTAGIINTSQITISGVNSKLKIFGNRLQVFDNQPVPVERVAVGDVNGDGTVYGFKVRSADGQTVLFDHNGVYSAGITDGAITNPKIATGAVGTDTIQDSAITNAKVANAAIDTAKIKTAAITTALIADAAITSAKIQNLAVGTGQIADGAIITAKIGDATITGAKIANATIAAAHIANAAIGTAQIADASITATKIKDLTWDKGRGGTLQLGGLDNTLGQLQMVDSTGEIAGSFVVNANGQTELSAAKISSPSIVQLQDSLTMYVNSSTGNDMNDGLTSGKAKRTISAALSSLQRYIKRGKVVLNITGAFDEPLIRVSGFHGEDGLILNFSGGNTTVTASWEFIGNSVPVILQSPAFTNRATLKGNGSVPGIHVFIQGCTLTQFIWLTIDSAQKHDTCIYSQCGGHTFVRESEIGNAVSTTYLAKFGTHHLWDMRGTYKDYGININDGALLTTYGICPKRSDGATSNCLWESGGKLVAQLGTVAYASGTWTGSTPPPPPSTAQYRANATNAYRYDLNGWRSTYSGGNDRPYQGNWSGYNNLGAIWIDNSSFRSFIGSRTIDGGRIYIHRYNGGGSSGAVNLHLRGITNTSASGAPNLAGSDYGYIGSWAWDEAKWVTLPTQALIDLKNGTINALTLWDGSSNYFIALGCGDGDAPIIEVTCH